MKRWPVWIVLLYAVTLVAMTVPAVSFVFISHKEKMDPGTLFGSWEYWVWIVILMLNQWALLSLPVDLASKRPAGKRSLVFQIAASALSMGLLIAGLAVGMGEVIKGEASFGYTGWIFFGVLGISWLFWARVFATWSRKPGFFFSMPSNGRKRKVGNSHTCESVLSPGNPWRPLRRVSVVA